MGYPKEKILNPLLALVRSKGLTNEVRVMPLIKELNLRDSRSLREAIHNRAMRDGRHTVADIGQLMFDHSDGRVTLQECIDYCDDVGVRRSLKGNQMEVVLMNKIKNRDGYTCEESDEELDVKYNVDLVATNPKGETIYIQVKPESYLRTSEEVQNINKEKERRLGSKIWYCVYDANSKFTWI